MTKVNLHFLDIDSPFPDLALKLLSGDVLNLPEGFGDRYGILLIYRGDW